jgi:hypothetical protein
MKREEQISIITNSIGWAVYSDKYPQREIQGVMGIDLPDDKTPLLRKAAEEALAYVMLRLPDEEGDE